jgi:hypothetical protein
MSPFELVFALFGLLLGLAIAEVLGGFARVLKLKRLGGAAAEVRIGWLTPLLGLLVILDQTSFWLTAYNMRDVIPARFATLIAVLAIAGTYYLVSTLIFPDDPAKWPDFDEHYDRQNRLVLSAVLAAGLAVFLFAMVLAASGNGDALIKSAKAAMPAGPVARLIGNLAGIGTFPLLIALIILKSRRANIGLLVILIGLNLASALAALF